jgi:hypothetical protein
MAGADHQKPEWLTVHYRVEHWPADPWSGKCHNKAVMPVLTPTSPQETINYVTDRTGKFDVADHQTSWSFYCRFFETDFSRGNGTFVTKVRHHSHQPRELPSAERWRWSNWGARPVI